AQHQTGDHPVRPQRLGQRRFGLDRAVLASALRAGEEDHRQHGKDARRDAGDQATEKADQYECEHVRSFVARVGPTRGPNPSVGANTVNSLPLRVSTRFTFGLSLPDTAEVSVVSSGLFDAATATGSCAIPVTDPGPVGFCAA